MHAKTFPAQALLRCEDCRLVFINWTRSRGGTVCRACGGARLHEVRWQAPREAQPAGRVE